MAIEGGTLRSCKNHHCKYKGDVSEMFRSQGNIYGKTKLIHLVHDFYKNKKCWIFDRLDICLAACVCIEYCATRTQVFWLLSEVQFGKPVVPLNTSRDLNEYMLIGSVVRIGSCFYHKLWIPSRNQAMLNRIGFLPVIVKEIFWFKS